MSLLNRKTLRDSRVSRRKWARSLEHNIIDNLLIFALYIIGCCSCRRQRCTMRLEGVRSTRSTAVIPRRLINASMYWVYANIYLSVDALVMCRLPYYWMDPLVRNGYIIDNDILSILVRRARREMLVDSAEDPQTARQHQHVTVKWNIQSTVAWTMDDLPCVIRISTRHHVLLPNI